MNRIEESAAPSEGGGGVASPAIGFWLQTVGAALALAACSSASTGPGSSAESGPRQGGFVFNAESEAESGVEQGTAPLFNECAGLIFQGEQLSSDLFLMLDHTGSMGEDCPLRLDRPVGRNGSKWCYATHAFARYFTSEQATGSRVALQFMSGEDFVCAGGPNNGASRAAVGMTSLPVSASHPLVVALDEDNPVGGLGTQIEAALRGIVDFTTANRVAGRGMVGVLITDGDPTACEQDIDDLAEIIEDHYESTGLRTFVIGMNGASLNNLERLARAGGAPEHGPRFCGGQDDCHFWSVGNGDPEAFAAALAEIQSAAAVPCSYAIPQPPDGSQLDVDLVNVQLRLDAQLPQVVGRVARCSAGEGWLYDDPTSPSLLQLCPATCEAVTAPGVDARVDIAYGCRSVIR